MSEQTSKDKAGKKAEAKPERKEPQLIDDSTNPKRMQLSDIYAKRRAQLEEDVPDLAAQADDEPAGGPEPDEPQAPVEEPERPEKAGEEAPAASADGGEPEPEPAPKPAPVAPQEPMVVVSIDGKQVEVPASQVRTRAKVYGEEREIDGLEWLRGYQTSEAARQRLDQANELYRQVREAQSQQPQPAKQEQPEPEANAEPSDEEVEAIARKLQFGDEKEAAEVVRFLLKARGKTQSTVSPEETAKLAAGLAQEQLEYNQAIDKAKEDYKDVLEDPGLQRIAVDYVHTLRSRYLQQIGHDLTGTTPQDWLRMYHAEQRNGRVPRHADLLKQAGEATRQWRDGLVGKYAPPPKQEPSGNGFEEKREAKRKSPVPPTPATVRKEEPKAPPPPTGREIVQRMQRQRGQA